MTCSPGPRPTRSTGCPQVVLATRLDRLDGFRDAQELGTAMRLPGPPAAVLSRVAAGRPALLVLDQVDAFGTGSGRNPARLEAVTEALREARALDDRFQGGSADKPSRPSTVEDRPADLVSQPLIV